jgi:hypothetical protein
LSVTPTFVPAPDVVVVVVDTPAPPEVEAMIVVNELKPQGLLRRKDPC